MSKPFTIFSILYLVFLSTVNAEEATDKRNLEDDLSGFTTDNTITRLGHDFVRYLSDFRNSEFPNAKYNLSVYERPSARWGNLIWITYDGQTIYRQFLPPNMANVKPLAENIAKQIHRNISEIKLKMLLDNKQDLYGDGY
jgi:curli production assembly/transport component CsgE